MGKPSKAIMDFMAAYKIDADEIWEVRAGGAWAIKHSALERVAAEQKITFERPAVLQIDLEKKLVAMVVFATMGERSEWSTGEASPHNNKNSYAVAMAEKRAKDRCVLKLLNSHGALYSEDEAEDFKRPNPHVTRPEDIVPAVEYDQYGHPVDNIPLGDPSIETLPKAKVRAEFEACQKEMHSMVSTQQLEKWGRMNADRIASYPNDWQAIMRGLYTEHMASLRSGKAA